MEDRDPSSIPTIRKGEPTERIKDCLRKLWRVFSVREPLTCTGTIQEEQVTTFINGMSSMLIV